MVITTDELIKYCRRYADRIFVWAEINEKWESIPFSELSLKSQNEHIERWWKEDRFPYRIKEAGE